MSTTTTMDATIAAFAQAIRLRLDDLPPEDVDDLTEGLEADLLEQAADADARLDLASPEAYADELRAAAGLPPRTDVPGTSLARRARIRLAEAREKLREAADAPGLRGQAISLLLVLRPAWWVLRGWVIYQITVLVVGQASPLPDDLITWVLLLAAVTLSIKWGRGEWAPGRVLGGIRTAATIISILVAPFLLGWATTQGASASAMADAAVYTDPTGLQLDGKRVTNIFPYDSEGEPLTDVQLFDQDGEPLISIGASREMEEYDWSSDGETVLVPHRGDAPGAGWNIYPLDEGYWDDDGSIAPSRSDAATPPFRSTYPVAGTSSPAPEPSATPSAHAPSDPQQ